MDYDTIVKTYKKSQVIASDKRTVSPKVYFDKKRLRKEVTGPM